MIHPFQLLQMAKVVQGTESADCACGGDEAIWVSYFNRILNSISSVLSIGVRSQGMEAAPLIGFKDIRRGA